MNTNRKYRIAICDMQPIAAEGLKSVLIDRDDVEFSQSTDTLEAALDIMTGHRGGPIPDVVLVDKAFGSQAVLNWLSECRLKAVSCGIVIWGLSMTEPESLRFLQTGARGILRKSADMATMLACLRTVASGRTWMQDAVFREFLRRERNGRSELTPREQQVLELVEQGFKNKEIANHLGIQPGTVKIHLKHIFEKTGVRGRYGLALSGLKERGALSLTA